MQILEDLKAAVLDMMMSSAQPHTLPKSTAVLSSCALQPQPAGSAGPWANHHHHIIAPTATTQHHRSVPTLWTTHDSHSQSAALGATHQSHLTCMHSFLLLNIGGRQSDNSYKGKQLICFKASLVLFRPYISHQYFFQCIHTSVYQN